MSVQQCIDILDYSNWEILKAIKIAKLHKLGADLTTCSNALEANSWNVSKAAQWILQQDEVAHV